MRPLPCCCRSLADRTENIMETPLIDLSVTNTQFQPDENFKQRPPGEAESNRNTGDSDPMAALFKSCMLKSNIIKSHAKIKPSTVHFRSLRMHRKERLMSENRFL